MNGPYRIAACVDADTSRQACSPCLCCQCATCRETSQRLAKWLAAHEQPPQTPLRARAGRVAATAMTGLIAGVLLAAASLAGSAANTRNERLLRSLADEHRAAQVRLAHLETARSAAEQRAARLAADDTPNRAGREAALDEMASRPMPWPPALLGAAGAESHDPDVLLPRALRLLSDGLPLQIERSTLTEAEVTEATRDTSWSVSPLKRHDAVIGFLINRAPRGSLAAKSGLRSGDIVTAVNGYPISSPDQALSVYARVRDQRRALFEIIRGDRRVVLLVQMR